MTDAEERLRLKKSELRERLGPTCSQWPPELFEAMLDGLAQITVKYDGISSPSTYDRRATDRLIGDLNAALNESRQRRQGS